MKKLFKVFAIIAMIGLFVAPAHARMDKFIINVYADTGVGIIGQVESLVLLNGSDSSGSDQNEIIYKVLYRNTNTAATLYGDKVFTAKTNPVVALVFTTDGKIVFWMDTNDSSYATATGVDIGMTDVNGGYSLFLEDVKANVTHTAIINERPNEIHHGFISWTCQSDVVDTGIDFDSYTKIISMDVEIVTAVDRVYNDADNTTSTAAGTAEIDVGLLATETGGDADGFIQNARIHQLRGLDTVGFVQINAASALGTVQFESHPGTTSVTYVGWTTPSGVDWNDGYYHGALFRKSTAPGTKEYVIWDAASVAKSLVYQTSGNDGAGYLHWSFVRMR